MVRLVRVGQEVRREVLRPSSLWAIAGVLALCLLVGLFAITQAALELYTPAIYLFLPMLMAPLAAHRIARDRERDLSAVHATTPMGSADVLLGKVVALFLLLALAMGATLPMLYVMTAQAATGAFIQLIPLVAWGAAIGTVSMLVGLLIGYARLANSVGALSTAFVVVLLWFLLPLQRGRLYGWADSMAELRVIRALLHASPFTWALDALATGAAYLDPAHASSLVGLAILLVPLALGLGALALGWQHMDGWHPRALARPVASCLLAASLVATGALLWAWDHPAPGGPTQHGEPVADQLAGDVRLQLGFETHEPWSTSTPGTLHITFIGEPNATVRLTSLTFTSANLTVQTEVDLPREIHLDQPIPSRGQPHVEGDQAGHAALQIPVTLVLHRLDQQPAIETHLTLDGTSATVTTTHRAWDHRLPLAASMLTGGATLVVVAGAAVLVPRRLNTW